MTSTLSDGSSTATQDPWREFDSGPWRQGIDVAGFIRANYTPYEGDASFLTGPTTRTQTVWDKVAALFPEERRKGVYDVDTKTPASITAHAPGYIDRELELIHGLQTDAPLKRAIVPNGGFRMVKGALEAYGYEMDPFVEEVFTKYPPPAPRLETVADVGGAIAHWLLKASP